MSVRLKIVSFGCSYTAGAEMLDHEIDPRADHIKRLKGLDFWYHQHRTADHKLEKRILDREAQMAWPAIMARRLGGICDNRAEHGSSLSQIVIRLEQALEHRDIDDHTWVFVGLTHPERSLRFYSDRQISGWRIADWQSWPNLDWHKATVLDLYDDKYIWWLYTQDMLRMVDLARTRFGSRLRMFNMVDHRATLEKIGDETVITRRLGELVLSGMWMHDLPDLFGYAVESSQRHAGEHPRVEVHEQWVGDILPAVIKTMGQ